MTMLFLILKILIPFCSWKYDLDDTANVKVCYSINQFDEEFQVTIRVIFIFHEKKFSRTNEIIGDRHTYVGVVCEQFLFSFCVIKQTGSTYVTIGEWNQTDLFHLYHSSRYQCEVHYNL